MSQQELDSIWKRPERRYTNPHTRVFHMRNVLNIIFMLMVVGAIATFFYAPGRMVADYPVWGIIVGAAIVVKTIEIALRIIYKPQDNE